VVAHVACHPVVVWQLAGGEFYFTPSARIEKEIIGVPRDQTEIRPSTAGGEVEPGSSARHARDRVGNERELPLGREAGIMPAA